jgi:hypothetical protein
MHLQPGSSIRIFQKGMNLAVEPELSELQAALWAILSCNNLDWVVTMALQQHGVLPILAILMIGISKQFRFPMIVLRFAVLVPESLWGN